MKRSPVSASSSNRAASRATASTIAPRKAKPPRHDRTSRRPDNGAGAQDRRGHRQTSSSGGDPLGRKQDKRDAPTVDDILDRYLASEEFADKADVTQAIDRGRIERHLRPLLGKRHAHLVTEQDVRKAFAAIRDGKTAVDVKTIKRGRARVRGGPGAARMAIILLGIILNWAVRARPAEREPGAAYQARSCRHARRHPRGRCGLCPAIQDARADGAGAPDPAAGRGCDPAHRLDRLSARRGCRPALASCRARPHCPAAARAQGRQATGKPRIIGLPAAAQAIIARQPEGGPDDFVFAPARGDGGAIELSHVWDKVRAEAELPAKVTLHGLRHPRRAIWRWPAPRQRRSWRRSGIINSRPFSDISTLPRMLDRPLLRRRRRRRSRGIEIAAGAKVVKLRAEADTVMRLRVRRLPEPKQNERELLRLALLRLPRMPRMGMPRLSSFAATATAILRLSIYSATPRAAIPRLRCVFLRRARYGCGSDRKPVYLDPASTESR